MKKMVMFDYGNGCYISEEDIKKVTDKLIVVLKTELQEEAQCVSVIGSILDEVKAEIQNKRVTL